MLQMMSQPPQHLTIDASEPVISTCVARFFFFFFTTVKETPKCISCPLLFFLFIKLQRLTL